MKFSITPDRAQNGAWTVECPALGVSHGRTTSEALRKARESVALCLAALDTIPARTTRKPKHTFSSENLIGSLATGLPTGDIATIRRLAQQRLREKKADTGLLKAALDRDDDAHARGAAELRAHAPFHTCEAVLGELAFLLGTGVPGLQLVVQGDLILDFDLGAEAQAVLGLLQKYRDRQMDLADAGLLRRPELEPRCQVWTVDRGDFRIDRRHGRQPVPCEVPPEQR